MISQPHKTQPAPKEEWQVGQRAHDGGPLLRVLAQGALSETTRLHQLITGPGTFHVLVFTSDMLRSTASSSTLVDGNGIAVTNESRLAKDLDSSLQSWRSQWAYSPTTGRSLFQVHVLAALPDTVGGTTFEDPTKVVADALAVKEQGDGRIYWDQTKIVHERYGVPVKGSAGAIIVIRPDSHIGFRVQGAGQPAWQDVDAYFYSILSSRP